MATVKTRQRWTKPAREVLDSFWERGLRKRKGGEDLFRDCLAALCLLEPTATERRLELWLMNRRRERAAEERETASAVASHSAAVLADDGLTNVEGDLADDGVDDVIQDNAESASAAADEDTPQLPSKKQRVARRITRRNNQKATVWHEVLRDVGRELQGENLGQGNLATMNATASARYANLEDSERAEYERRAAERNAEMEYSEGVAYTPEQKKDLVEHYTKILNKSLTVLGKLGTSIVGCRQNDEGNAMPQMFTAGPNGKATELLMESKGIFVPRYMLGTQWGFGAAPTTVAARRVDVRMALLKMINDHRQTRCRPPLIHFPSSELEHGCPIRLKNWPEGLSYKPGLWGMDNLDTLAEMIPRLSERLQPHYVEVLFCDGCIRCDIRENGEESD